MRLATVLAALLLAAAAPFTVSAHDYRAGDLVVDHPFALESKGRADVGSGYLAIRNDGAEADRLIEVRADFARVELHTMSVDAGGVMRMRPFENGVAIAPGATVTLAPGGDHIMFLDLDAPLLPGETRRVTLVFERAGALDVEMPVEARGAHGAGHDHAAPKP